MGCCGNKNGSAGIEYQVKCNNGTVKTVATLAEVKITLATNGGGSYRSVPKSAPKA